MKIYQVIIKEGSDWLVYAWRTSFKEALEVKAKQEAEGYLSDIQVVTAPH